MNSLVSKLFLLLVFSVVSIPDSRGQSANSILNGVHKKLMKANDYSVQINIKVDLPFIKMMPVEAKIYFKQKNNFKVVSKSIAIIPRQGFDQLTRILNDANSFTAVSTGNEVISNKQTSVISIIPDSDTGDLILGKFWIDPGQSVVMKSQLTTKSNGTILTEYTYGSQLAYGLPDLMVFTVDVKKFKVPKSVSTDINNTKKQKTGNKKGKIYIKLYNYSINKGISNTVFKK